MQKNKLKLSSLSEHEKRPILEAIKKTAIYYMEQGFSWSYSCATASHQAMFQKGDVSKALAKEPDIIAIREKYTQAKRFDRRKFNFGVEASKEALRLFEELGSKK